MQEALPATPAYGSGTPADAVAPLRPRRGPEVAPWRSGQYQLIYPFSAAPVPVEAHQPRRPRRNPEEWEGQEAQGPHKCHSGVCASPHEDLEFVLQQTLVPSRRDTDG